MRRRILVLVGATVLLVLVAFAVPLATLIRSVAESSAVSAATVQAQVLTPAVAGGDRSVLVPAVQNADARDASDVSVFLPDGAPAPRSPVVRLGLLGTSASTEAAGGRELVFAVTGATAGNAVIRVFVPDAELTRGVTRSWLLLGGLSLVLLAGGLLLADRLARTLVDAHPRAHMSPPPPPYTEGFFASDDFHPSAIGYKDWADFAVDDAESIGFLRLLDEH